jgi:hypothetical protein
MALDSADDLAAIFSTDEHAVAATYAPKPDGSAIETEVVVDTGLDRYQADGHGVVTERRTTIHVLVSDVATSKRGDEITADGETYTVDEIEADDGKVRTLLVHA